MRATRQGRLSPSLQSAHQPRLRGSGASNCQALSHDDAAQLVKSIHTAYSCKYYLRDFLPNTGCKRLKAHERESVGVRAALFCLQDRLPCGFRASANMTPGGPSW